MKEQYIPAPLKSAVKGGYVTDTSELIDKTKNKRQNVINQETDNEISGIKGGSTKSIADLSEDIANEAERASGVEAGLRESIDELGQIGLDPDNAISTDGDDFDGDTTAKRSKIPTIGAIIDGNPGVYDVSKRNPTGGPNNDGTFTLEYILANADTLIPTSRRHGGMEICFVHSSDNKYVQFRYMSSSTDVADFTDVANWQGVDDEPTAGSDNLVKSSGVAEINKGVAFKKLENLNISLNNVGQIAINYGSIGSSTSAHHSDMMPIGDIKFLYVKSYVNQYTCGVFFYKDNEFISSNFVGQAILSQTNACVDGFVPVPNGAVYMAFCSYEDGAEAYTAYYTEALSKEDGATIQQNITDENNRAEGAENTLQQNITALANAGYAFKGCVNTVFNPGTPTNKCFYIALTVGTYTNFNNLQVSKDETLSIFLWDNNSWTKQSVKRNFYTIFNANEYLGNSNVLTLADAVSTAKTAGYNSIARVITYRSSSGASIAIFKDASYISGWEDLNNWKVLDWDSDIESLQNEIDNIGIKVNLLDFERTAQLYNNANRDVYFKMRLLTSTLKFQANVAGLTACIEINGVVGETYTMAIIDPHTYDELGLQRAWTIAAGNIKPVNGGDYTEYGNSGYTDKFAQITLTENAKYLYINFNRVDETTADAYNNVLEKMVVVKSNIIPTEYIPYLKYVVNESDLSTDLQKKINNNTDSVKKDQGTTNRGKALVVGNDGMVVPGPTIIEPANVEGVTYETQKTLYLGNSILTSDSQVTLGTGWSGNLANGFTHASGNDGNLSININTQANSKYLIRYSSDVLGEYTLLMDIEDLEDVDPYNGTTNCRLGFISNGSGRIIFKAASNYAGSIFNLEILPIVSIEEATEEYIVQSDNVTAGSLSHNITGWINVALGPTNALNNNENGSRNIAIGQNSLLNLRAGTRNIGIGTFSMLRLINGERNIAIGADALYWAQRAEDNIIIGKAAAANMAEGNINIKRNIAIGTQALLGNQNDSEDNVAIGYRALGSNPSIQNVAIGTKAGYYLRGIRNVAIGHNAQSQLYCTGNDNTVIGADAKVYAAGGTSENPVIINNSIAIGKGANATKSNQCVIGNAQVEEFVLGNKKIVFNNDNTITWETIS